VQGNGLEFFKMAIEKEFTTQSGITLTYWKIIGLHNVDLLKGECIVQIAGYVSEDDRRNNPENYKLVTGYFATFADISSDIRPSLYGQAKINANTTIKLPILTDGKDV